MISSPSSSSHCSPTSTNPNSPHQIQRRHVVGSDAGAYGADVSFPAGPIEQVGQRGPGVAAAPLVRIDRVADLDHAGVVRWPVETGPADGAVLVQVPDHPGDPRRGRRIIDELGAADLPGPEVVGIDEVVGQVEPAEPAGGRQIGGGQGVDGGSRSTG